jgi:hypothetical protein
MFCTRKNLWKIQKFFISSVPRAFTWSGCVGVVSIYGVTTQVFLQTDVRYVLLLEAFRDVHVVLVSLLADQLSGQFLIFLVGQKTIVHSQNRKFFFVHSLDLFCPV